VSFTKVICDVEVEKVCILCIPDAQINKDSKDWLDLVETLEAIGDGDYDDPYGGFYPNLPTGQQVDKEKQAEEWKKEGKCPKCGQLGSFSHLQYVCSLHGPY
jgi:hypothetical protein